MLRTLTKPQPISSSEFSVETPLATNTNKDVMVLISVLKEIAGSKKPSLEIVHAKLIKELAKHNPASMFVLVAGLLKRWNYWEMVRELSDEELKEILSDIPDDINEEKLIAILAHKFTSVAEKLEKDISQKLSEHIKDLTHSEIPVTTWSKRNEFQNIQETREEDITTFPNLDDFNKTKNDFLQNKGSLLDKAQKRMTRAQPNLAKIDFEKLTLLACFNYALEEYRYFNKLTKAEIFHRGKKPEVFKSIFSNNDALHWQAFSFKETSKKNNFTLARVNSTPSTLAERRFKFFTPLSIEQKPKKEAAHQTRSQTPPEKQKRVKPMIEHSSLSPKTEKHMRTLIELFSKTPPSEQKELALKKIAEATALLHTPR